MLKLIFRILFVALGLFTTYVFGKDIVDPIRYRISGISVQGRISGFLAGRNNPSVQPESTGVRKGKRRARRPVFRYPVANHATDSLEGRSGSRALFTFTNFELHEQVTVVFDPKEPAQACLFSVQTMFFSFLIVLFGLFMIRMGLLGKA